MRAPKRRVIFQEINSNVINAIDADNGEKAGSICFMYDGDCSWIDKYGQVHTADEIKDNKQETVYISNVFAYYKNFGIASKLFEHVIQRNNDYVIHSIVNPDNIESIGLHKKYEMENLGYEDRDEEPWLFFLRKPNKDMNWKPTPMDEPVTLYKKCKFSAKSTDIERIKENFFQTSV